MVPLRKFEVISNSSKLIAEVIEPKCSALSTQNPLSKSHLKLLHFNSHYFKNSPYDMFPSRVLYSSYFLHLCYMSSLLDSSLFNCPNNIIHINVLKNEHSIICVLRYTTPHIYQINIIHCILCCVILFPWWVSLCLCTLLMTAIKVHS
jgi:hypothetical protein